MSICRGLEDIIDHHLGLMDVGSSPHYTHKESCLRLSQAPVDTFRVLPLVEEMIARIRHNKETSEFGCTRLPSPENWRWSKQCHIQTDPPNPSKEKALEKAIVRQTGPEWVNQIPTASGLYGPTSDQHRNVDLGRRLKANVYDLIELKVETGTPLLATAEILHAVALYLFARNHYPSSSPTDNGLLDATAIHWKVLAPAGFYRPYNLSWLAAELADGLDAAAKARVEGLRMDFGFVQFPEWFEWPCAEAKVLAALNEIRQVEWRGNPVGTS